jgi:hypothetical protein
LACGCAGRSALKSLHLLCVGKTYHPGIPKEYDCRNFPTDCPSWSVPYQPGARIGKDPNGVPPNGCVNVSESGETGCASGAWEACNDPDNTIIDGNVTNLAIEQLRKAKTAGLPFFLNVGIHKPHGKSDFRPA